MKNIRRLNKIKMLKTLKKFVVLNSLLLVLILAYIYFSNNINKTENNNPNELKEMKENWYDTIDEVSEFNNNSFTPLAENSKGIQEIVESHKDIPVYTDEQGNKYITYESFGTSSEEGFDNYQAIYDAHIYANYYGYNIKATLDTYHIYKLEQTKFIPIQTSTDWNNATFIIHDEEINNLDTRKGMMFVIESKQAEITITDKNILENIKINKMTTKIPKLSGYGNAMCIVYNEDKMQYIRYGTNQDEGKSQRDIFKIDNEGNILNEIQWDFDNISEILIMPIPEETVTVENGNFVTILPEEKYEQDTGYFYRNICCKRSNTIIQNINHTVNNKNYIGGPYKGFIYLYEVADVDIKNCILFSHKYEEKSNYDLFLEYAVDIKITDVTSNDIEDEGRWGIGGTHYAKDITYENCTLNRIDSHTGVHNLTISNCTIGIKGITVIGNGNLKISNSTILSNNYLIELRQDYGSTWDGNIYITNCTYKPKNAQQLVYFKASYDDTNTFHDFGYDLYLPNIFIDGLTIDDKNSTYNDNNLYMFYNSQYYTGISNGDLTNIYNLPEKICIRNYETTSGRNIKLFYQEFYKNLEELGINYSIPLSYKKEVQILNSDKENINNDTITNKDVTIKYDEIEGIQTQLIINSSEVGDTEVILSDNGNYSIQIKYSNDEGQLEEKNINITIDKEAPQISDIEDGKIYFNSVKPQVMDDYLKEVQVTLNGQAIEGYSLGNELTQEGQYELMATDKAGNVTKVVFYIFLKDENGYQIKDNNIMNIYPETTVKEFKEAFTLLKEYVIKNADQELTEEDSIATGDILEDDEGKIFTLIVLGDLNQDGKLSLSDISLERKYILKMIDLSEIQKLATDVNFDNNISLTDISIMRKLVLEMK